MSTAVAAPAQSAPPAGRMAIQASYASLGFACVGLVLLAIGVFYQQVNFGIVTPWFAHVSTLVGDVFLSLAIFLHIDHLSYRIGRTAVVLFLIALALPFLFRIPRLFIPSLNHHTSWANVATAAYGTAFIALGLGMASIAIHKEKQIERGLVQVADVGATDPADVTVHASFFSLISTSIGMILYAIGLFQVIGNPTGTREGWILKVLGMTLLSIGIISHVEHLGRHIGNGAVVFAILGAILNAVANLPFAISHSATTTKSWQVVSGYGTGAAWLCVGIAVGLVILRKRSIEAESAKS